MKTKTILLALSVILSCVISRNAFAQTPVVPTQHDFYGTWIGADAAGHHITMTLSAKWNCSLTVDGIPFTNNAVVNFRLPEYDPRFVTDNGAPSTNSIIVKFYTQNAIHNVQASVSANAAMSSGNSLVPLSVDQIYSGTAVVVIDANPQTMELYVDFNNFSAVPPSQSTIDNLAPGSPNDNIQHYSLIKQ